MADRRAPSPDTLLHIYLNDHRSAGSGGLSLTERVLASNAGTPYEQPLRDLVAEIGEDLVTLDALRRALGVRRNPVKDAAVAVGERVGRLKPNGQLRGYSPLSRVLELEGLAAAVNAKRHLWSALSLLQGADARLGSFDFEGLLLRAEDQADRIEPLHRRAVWAAMARTGAADEPPGPSSAGGEGVTPGGTNEVAADTSPLGGDDHGLAERVERLQSTDEDTIPPST
jgi:hypothetical protein